MNKFYLFGLLTTVLYANNQEELIMDIEKSLIAVCCWSGTVYDHGNSDMETIIASMVQSGNTKSEIMNHFVNQYGERVLAIPVMSGFNMLAWIAPILIGLIGILIWYLYLNSPSTFVKPIKNEYNDISNIDQIEQELKEME
ncbi:MAG: cytochrome c-type biogenesis protein CcmH [Candidatus Neomarinimicrobiota bacterium]|nr:cytochrome c-type biogenesis protein CcmH [Candidatus Neomarinimicrobiota bacterium]MED5266939.1 cytochrome c-type biogenesis protein CcmH [Candidatus Neomarinimicrobiota bacterium]|tara:strand:- start:1715 stop:2137 length:423 start_codon:yes stop_codon:yes gene_type:complete